MGISALSSHSGAVLLFSLLVTHTIQAFLFINKGELFYVGSVYSFFTKCGKHLWGAARPAGSGTNQGSASGVDLGLGAAHRDPEVKHTDLLSPEPGGAAGLRAQG